MKKLFILAAALLALASCQKEQASYVEDGSIKFTNAQTRATLVSNEATLVRKGFRVLGYAQQNSETDKLFDTELAKSNGTWWEMTTKKYWADNTNYNFFAVYDSLNNTNGAVKFTDATFNDNYATTTYSFNNTGENDLIIAGTFVNVTSGRTEPANLAFKHALSRVAFKFVNAYKSEGNTITLAVTGLKLLDKKGNAVVTLTNTENGLNFSWGTPDYSAAENDILYSVQGEFVGANAISQGTPDAEGNVTGNSATTDYKYIFPAKDAEYKIACVITATDNDGNIVRTFDYSAGTLVKTSTTTETLTHEAGKSYTYTMTVAQNLNEIMFDVDVEEWATDKETSIVFPDANN